MWWRRQNAETASRSIWMCGLMLAAVNDTLGRINVIIFRFTRTLLDRLPNAGSSTLARSTTALGDWYFKLLFARPEWLQLRDSQRSRPAE